MKFRVASPSSVESRVARDDRRVLQWQPINLLLIGPAEQISAVIADLWPALREPIDLCEAGTFRPPAPGGTLILHNAAEMPAAQQAALFAWLDTVPDTRVVTTVCAPLFPKVEIGSFPAALYYRLNTITIDLSAEV